MARAIAVVGLLVALSCRGETPRPPPGAPGPSEARAAPPVGDVTAEGYRMPRLPSGRVTVALLGGKRVTFDVEVAATRGARTRGLMWRYALAESAGMLFIFPREQPLSFWMRNTLIPLDMVFIDAKGRVVSIIENAEPRTLDARPSAGPATYVLEVAGGTCARKGLRAGAQVTFEGITNLVPEE
ncbi:MAG: DUF192 domain-containing protein [Myxococcaceae bacterium]|jgi:uncharacterized membrane protein (UPF0127 family)|nr:DUF192 domain-containing protein [Myxococcaceae bacterium]